MDLVSAAVNLQQASLASKVQFAVARKVLQTQRDSGQAAIQLLEAATGGPAQAGDQLTAAATGLGAEIDVYG